MKTSVKELTDEQLLQQTREQYRAVVHMANAISKLHTQLGRTLDRGPRGVIEFQCCQSAVTLNQLGEVLNVLDAFDEKEDGWTHPIFQKAYNTSFDL